MELNEALDIAGRMKHFYRAFEKLESVLNLASQGDTLIAKAIEKQEEVEQLDIKIVQQKAELSRRISTEGIGYDTFKKETDSKIAELNTKFLEKSHQIDSLIDAKNKDLENLDQKMKQRIAAAESKFLEDATVRKSRLTELDNEIKVKEARLLEVNKTLNDIKSKI